MTTRTVGIVPLLLLSAFANPAHATNDWRAAKRFALQVSRGQAERYRVSQSQEKIVYRRDGMTAEIGKPVVEEATGPAGQIGRVRTDSSGWAHVVLVDTRTENGRTSRSFSIPLRSSDPAFRGKPRQEAMVNFAVSAKQSVTMTARLPRTEEAMRDADAISIRLTGSAAQQWVTATR
jgi:hypothetical protein